MTHPIQGLLGMPGAISPFLGLGAGLLQAAGPQTDPSRGSVGFGLSQGLRQMSALQQAQQQQAYREQLMQMQQQRFMQQAAERKQAEEQRAAQQEALAAYMQSSGLPQEAQGLLGAFPGRAAEGIFGQMFAEQPQAPGKIRELEAFMNMSPEQQAAFRDLFGTKGTTVTQTVGGIGGGLATRGTTREELDKAGLSHINPQDVVVDEKGRIKSKPNRDAPSEQEAKAVRFAAMMNEAQTNLGEFDTDPTWTPDVSAAYGPHAVRQKMASDKSKRYMDNAERWAESYIYLVSGATARKDEVDGAVRKYFRMPGDGPLQIQQKESARRRAEATARSGTGGHEVPGRAQPPGLIGGQPQPQPPPGSIRRPR